jgi:hypothetical protein
VTERVLFIASNSSSTETATAGVLVVNTLNPNATTIHHNETMDLRATNKQDFLSKLNDEMQKIEEYFG